MFTVIGTALLIAGLASFMTYIGYIAVYNKNRAWQWDEKRLRARGIADIKRTPEWERATTIGGYFLLAFGVFWWLFLIVYLLLPNK